MEIETEFREKVAMGVETEVMEWCEDKEEDEPKDFEEAEEAVVALKLDKTGWLEDLMLREDEYKERAGIETDDRASFWIPKSRLFVTAGCFGEEVFREGP